jgi:hypothetical protein
MNRYYSTGYGRFLTVDPFGGSGSAGMPGSWNRYTYSGNDPVNRRDPSGLFMSAEDCTADPDLCEDEDSGSGYCPIGPGFAGGFDPGDDGTGSVGGVDFGVIPDLAPCGVPVIPGDDGGDDDSLELDLETGGTGAGSNVLKWLPKALKRPKKFKTKAGGKCATDLGDIGLSAASVQSLAGTVQLLNAATNPKVYSIMQSGSSDFGVNEVVFPGVIFYDQNFFWQSSMGLLMGTLIHEMSHVANNSDFDDQLHLGLFVTPATANISKKIAADCFGYKGPIE